MICAVVLAAGQSRRMGTQKLLLNYGGRSVISHIVEVLSNSSVDQVVVVTGCDADRIRAEIAPSDVSVVFNEEHKAGMLSSVRCGFGAIDAGCRAVMIVLGDQPAITSGLIDEMIRAYRGTDKSIVVPTYKGRRGHPTIISMQYKDDVMSCYDDVGLRGLLRDHPDEVLELEVSSPGVCSDMDEPDDYAREIEKLNEG